MAPALAGLKTQVLPASMAAAGGPGREGHGEVEGRDDAEDAVRPQHRAGVRGRVAQVAHGPLVEVVVDGRLGVVAQQVGALLDLAQRLDAVLAHLDGHQGAVLHEPLADELGGAAQDLDAALPAEGPPGRLRGSGGGDGVAHVLPRARARSGPRGCPCRSGERSSNSPSPARSRPADDVGVGAAEAGARRHDAGLEGRVQVLVVRTQGGVGDLDAGVAASVIDGPPASSGPAPRAAHAWWSRRARVYSGPSARPVGPTLGPHRDGTAATARGGGAAVRGARGEAAVRRPRRRPPSAPGRCGSSRSSRRACPCAA